MLCVIAKIDNAARERLNELCKVVEEFDLPVRYLYGHITLVSYIGQNEADFIAQSAPPVTTPHATKGGFHRLWWYILLASIAFSRRHFVHGFGIAEALADEPREASSVVALPRCSQALASLQASLQICFA